MTIFQNVKKAGKSALIAGMVSSVLLNGAAKAEERLPTFFINPNIFSLERIISESEPDNRLNNFYSFKKNSDFNEDSSKDFSDKRGWNKSDTAYELAYMATHAIDWRQTRYIAKNPDKFYERNPILGKHPSVSDVDKYFAITAIAHSGVSYLLPNKSTIFGKEINPRRLWQMLTIGAQTAVIGNNFRIGVRIDW